MSTPSLKKVNLQNMQRPKTLIIIHYKGKRVSIPLFQSYDNITEYLYHQLHKFQVTVLEKQHKVKENRNNIHNIACFTAKEQDNNTLDLKMDIILSMLRLSHDYGKCRLDIAKLDISTYYKFMEIEPYYGCQSSQLIPQYQIYSILHHGAHYTEYLGRRIIDGRFFAIKVCHASSRLSQKQFSVLKYIHEEQHQTRSPNLQLIPEIQQIRKGDDFFIFIYEYCPGGKIKECFKNKIAEIDCLKYMKQLVWGIHCLHQKYNFIHRAVCVDNLFVDFMGNLRLFGYQQCLACYSSNYSMSSQLSYEQRYEISHVLTPPEVCRSGHYNKLVDFYGIGAVLYELYYGSSPQSDRLSKSRQKQGIEVAIQNLMNDNLKIREQFTNQIISELHEEKIKKISSSSSRQYLQCERLTLNRIQTGRSINIEQKMENKINHEEVIRMMKPSHDDQIYYLNPVQKKSKNKKSKEKSKNKSKEKSKQKSKEKPLKNENKIEDKKVKKSLNTQSKEKSLNKSLDSRNNSVKSKKSNSSKSKTKPSNPQGVKVPIVTVIKSSTFKTESQTNFNHSMKSPPKSRPSGVANVKAEPASKNH